MTELIHDPVRRQRLSFAREGDILHAEVWADPGGDVPAHSHPAQEERFQVLAGKVRFRIGGKRHEAGPGSRLVAPAGVRHSFCNTGDVEAHLRVEVEPALRLQEFLEDAARLARAGLYTRRGLPTRPAALPQLAELMIRYRDVTVMAFPPSAIQRLTMWPLARLRCRDA
jgi:mannose-6-phosphate isomerase-like protein (cupin superfamily)